MDYKHKYLKYKKKYLDLKNKFFNGENKSNFDENQDRNELKKIIHPIAGPKKITIILKPFLVYNGSENADSYLTGVESVDNIISDRIAQDYTKIKNILPFYYESAYYWFDSGLGEEKLLEKNINIKITDYEFKNGLIYLTAIKSNNNGFNQSDYQAIRICFDPDDFGPDGYMLQDIVIYDGSDTKQIIEKLEQKNKSSSISQSHILGYGGDDEDVLELAVRVVDILPHLDKK